MKRLIAVKAKSAQLLDECLPGKSVCTHSDTSLRQKTNRLVKRRNTDARRLLLTIRLSSLTGLQKTNLGDVHYAAKIARVRLVPMARTMALVSVTD